MWLIHSRPRRKPTISGTSIALSKKTEPQTNQETTQTNLKSDQETTHKGDHTTQISTQSDQKTTQSDQKTTQRVDNTTQTATQSNKKTTKSEFDTTQTEPQKYRTIQEQIINELRKNPNLSRKDLAKIITSVTEDGIKYHLKKLQEKGRLRRVGPNFGGHWEII